MILLLIFLIIFYRTLFYPVGNIVIDINNLKKRIAKRRTNQYWNSLFHFSQFSNLFSLYIWQNKKVKNTLALYWRFSQRIGNDLLKVDCEIDLIEAHFKLPLTISYLTDGHIYVVIR